MTDHLKQRRALTLAVEALHVQLGVTPSCEGVVADMLSSTFKRAKNFFADIFNAKLSGEAVVNLRADYESATQDYKHLTAADYVPLSRLPHEGMEGFVGQYTDYSSVVMHGLAYHERSLDEALKFYRQLVGSLITNKSSRAEWQDLTSRFKASEKAREAEDHDNAQFWRKGSHEAVTTVGAVVSRLADLHQLDKDAQELTSALRACDLKGIQNRVNEINELTGLLAADLEKGINTDLSKAQVQNLANGIMELAMQVEHYAVAVYRGHVYLNALKRLQKTVVAFK